MLKILLVASSLLSASTLPARAYEGPVGTQAGALAAVASARKHHKAIRYFDTYKKALPFLNDRAYAYEGIMMSGTAGDFMKDELYVIHDGTKHGCVTEEVIYPVWSRRNGAHVLRYARISRTVQPGRYFVGLDGRRHRQ